MNEVSFIKGFPHGLLAIFVAIIHRNTVPRVSCALLATYVDNVISSVIGQRYLVCLAVSGGDAGEEAWRLGSPRYGMKDGGSTYG